MCSDRATVVAGVLTKHQSSAATLMVDLKTTNPAQTIPWTITQIII